MIDQNEINEQELVTAFSKDVSYRSRFGDADKIPEVGDTEVRIITHIEDFEALKQEWKGLACKSDTHIFQTFEWNRIWWKHFGDNRKLHIIAVYMGDKLTGIAPLFEDDVTLFGLKLYSCLRFLGSYVSQPKGEPLVGSISYSDYLDCIIYPGYEQMFYLLILQHFNEIDSAFDEIILDEVSEESSVSNTLVPIMAISNYGTSYTMKLASPTPVILLDSTWKAYLDSMNVKDRYNARRYYKRSKQERRKNLI